VAGGIVKRRLRVLPKERSSVCHELSLSKRTHHEVLLTGLCLLTVVASTLKRCARLRDRWLPNSQRVATDWTFSFNQ